MDLDVIMLGLLVEERFEIWLAWAPMERKDPWNVRSPVTIRLVLWLWHVVMERVR